MKNIITTLFTTAALTVATSIGTADTVKLSEVHLCCKSCVKGVEKALSGAKGVTSDIDAKAGTVTLNGPEADLKKALAALSKGGFSGQSDGKLKVPTAKAKAGKVKSAKIVGVHLCCGKCVKGVKTALSSVPGVSGDTVENKAKSFEVTGDFEPQAVLAALAKAGFNGRVAK
jgi:copper chaperone CopZ